MHQFDVFGEDVQKETEAWLAQAANASLRQSLDLALKASFLTFSNIPPTYPHGFDERNLGLKATTSEALMAVRASWILAFRGLMPVAKVALRQVIEMNCLCLYFLEFELGSGVIRNWREGTFRTPAWRTMLNRLRAREAVRILETSMGWMTELADIYKRLSGAVHLGGRVSSYSSTEALGIRWFDPDAFTTWSNEFARTLQLCIAGLLCYFASYTRELPSLIEHVDTLYIEGFFDHDDLPVVRGFVGESIWNLAKSIVQSDPNFQSGVQRIVDNFRE